jgi:hypothetical protein
MNAIIRGDSSRLAVPHLLGQAESSGPAQPQHRINADAAIGAGVLRYSRGSVRHVYNYEAAHRTLAVTAVTTATPQCSIGLPGAGVVRIAGA